MLRQLKNGGRLIIPYSDDERGLILKVYQMSMDRKKITSSGNIRVNYVPLTDAESQKRSTHVLL